MSGPALPNVFILGTTRSGTSALQLSILESTRYTGNGEGHVISILPSLVEEVKKYCESHPAFGVPGTMASRLSTDDFLESLYEGLRRLYGKSFGARPFSDKTPTVEAIRSAPYLSKIWPGCRVIYCQRRAIENVASKLKKFPSDSFEKHCAEWRECMKAWECVRPFVDHYLTLDQIDLLENPHETARRVGEYLGLELGEVEALGEYLATRRPEKSIAYSERATLHSVGWDEDQKSTFLRVCGDTMRHSGYTLDASYRL